MDDGFVQGETTVEDNEISSSDVPGGETVVLVVYGWNNSNGDFTVKDNSLQSEGKVFQLVALSYVNGDYIVRNNKLKSWGELSNAYNSIEGDLVLQGNRIEDPVDFDSLGIFGSSIGGDVICKKNDPAAFFSANNQPPGGDNRCD